MFLALHQLKKSIREVCSPHISLSEAAKLLFTFVNLNHGEEANVPGVVISREIKQDCSTASSPHSWPYCPPAELINRHGSSSVLRVGFAHAKGQCKVQSITYLPVQGWISGIRGGFLVLESLSVCLNVLNFPAR